jgi:hypothetical protein
MNGGLSLSSVDVGGVILFAVRRCWLTRRGRAGYGAVVLRATHRDAVGHRYRPSQNVTTSNNACRWTMCAGCCSCADKLLVEVLLCGSILAAAELWHVAPTWRCRAALSAIRSPETAVAAQLAAYTTTLRCIAATTARSLRKDAKRCYQVHLVKLRVKGCILHWQLCDTNTITKWCPESTLTCSLQL